MKDMLEVFNLILEIVALLLAGLCIIISAREWYAGDEADAIYGMTLAIVMVCLVSLHHSTWRTS